MDIFVNHWLWSLERSGCLMSSIGDEATNKLIFALFEKLNVIKPVGNDNHRLIWIQAPRCTFEEYREYYYDDGSDDVPDEETVKKQYQLDFPQESCWYKLETIQHHDTGNGRAYYGIFLNNRYLLSINDANSQNAFPVDATEFVQWLIEETDSVIEQLRDGTYNEHLELNLPYSERTGKISRKDFFDAFANEHIRENYTAAIGEETKKRFLEDCSTGEIKAETALLCNMTARKFYEACACVYKAVGKVSGKCWRFADTPEEKKRYGSQFGGCTPKELYYIFADCRDNGLKNVPLDDAEAFADWYQEKGEYYEFNGNHPYEIIPSGSIEFSLHLYAKKKDGGYVFVISGDSYATACDTVLGYYSVKDYGFPVSMFNWDKIAARYKEEDFVSVVSDTHGMCVFGEELRLSDYEDKYDFIVSHTIWEPIPEVWLRD